MLVTAPGAWASRAAGGCLEDTVGPNTTLPGRHGGSCVPVARGGEGACGERPRSGGTACVRPGP